MMNRLVLAGSLVAALCALPSPAGAFCGFYVAGSDQQMFNDATQVVLMRSGTRTVLAMQNTYQGPPQDFAMVIPVPVVLHEGDVKTLPKDVFARVETMGAPRLVEYWERDPCAIDPPMEMIPASPMAARMEMAKGDVGGGGMGVKIEAKFTVGEYQILILSARDSTGLDAWLHLQNYKIPDGAEPLLRPYVEAGEKFFVAKVDPNKVKFVDGRAALSPLRFYYDSDDFSLPIRLGLANSSGTQDLIVNIFSPHQRYEVANYKNVTIPTNIDVDDSVKTKFGAFYAALFDRTVEKNPGAVVTEYAWQATDCDPCPGPQLTPGDLATLGTDVLGGTKGQVAPLDEIYDMVFTRLHARYGKDITNDLVFKQADAIVGGREFVQSGGKLEEGARPDSTNNFQGRYAIRHEWTGPITCANPQRHRWGGPPNGVSGGGTQAGTGLAFAQRNVIALPQVVKRDLPEIGVVAESKSGGGWVSPKPEKPSGSGSAPTPKMTAPTKSGCGCDSSDPGSLAAGLGLLGFVVRRRRPRARSKR
jgi:MYXO-CTERM domain-containing protein